MSKLSAFIILLFCLVHVSAIFSFESLVSGVVDFRGGKASSRSNNKLKPKNRSRDDDNDDENVPLRKTRASRRKDSRKRSRRRGKSFSDALNALGKQGYAVAEDIFRRGKVLRSSNFESMLLKATWPSDIEVSADVINQLVKHSIPAFRYSRHDADSDSNPYYMTLHKLWMKMIERDWRTVAKSLYILHSISRESGADHGRRFAAAIKDMSKTRNSKQPDHRYFDLKKLSGPQSDEDEEDSASGSALGAFEPVVQSYANYVIYRTKTFTSKFKEVKDVSETTKEKDAIAALKKAQQMISLGLKCTPVLTQRNAITGQMTKILANDLKDLWKLFAAKISPFLDASATQYADGSAANAEDKAELLKFYRDHAAEVVAFLANANKAFARLRIKIPTLTSEDTASLPSGEKVTSAMSALTGLRGGAAARAVTAVAADVNGESSVQSVARAIRDQVRELRGGGGARKPTVTDEDNDEDEEEEGADEDEEDGDDEETAVDDDDEDIEDDDNPEEDEEETEEEEDETDDETEEEEDDEE